jgi:CRISPR/Cas system-associated exonuclease Cas4 (RecB family)
MHAEKSDLGFMLYENKDDQRFVVIPVKMNDRNRKILDDAFDWMRRVRENWEAGNGTDSHIPKHPWTKRNKICRGCPLFDRCWPEDGSQPMSDVVIEAMEVAKP